MLRGFLGFLWCVQAAAVAANALACSPLLMEHRAAAFFQACETGKGWNGTMAFVASESAPFAAQVTDSIPGPKLSEVSTVKGYAEWMVC